MRDSKEGLEEMNR